MRASSSEASGSSMTSRRGLRQQRAADRDALLLAARQIGRPAAEQLADAEQLDDMVDLAGPAPRSAARTSGRRAGSAARSDAETAAPPGRHSRCGAAAPARRRRARCRSAPRRRRRCGRAPGRISPAIALTSEVLPDAGAAEQRGQPALALERGVEREVAEAVRDRDARASSAPAAPRRGWRARSTPRRANSAAIEIATATSVSRSAPSSPPGTCDQRVDRGRQGLRLAGDVRDEGDRRAELAERAREGQDHAGEDARQDQRQRDRQRTPRARWRRACRRRLRGGGRPRRSTAGSSAPSAGSP